VFNTRLNLSQISIAVKCSFRHEKDPGIEVSPPSPKSLSGDRADRQDRLMGIIVVTLILLSQKPFYHEIGIFVTAMILVFVCPSIYLRSVLTKKEAALGFPRRLQKNAFYLRPFTYSKTGSAKTILRPRCQPSLAQFPCSPESYQKLTTTVLLWQKCGSHSRCFSNLFFQRFRSGQFVVEFRVVVFFR